MRLNNEQQIVISKSCGPFLIAAVPGSGKTETLVSCVRALFEAGTRPKDILALTFTREAASEMEKRAGLEKSDQKVFSTFHSWCLSFVTKERTNFPFRLEKFPLLTPHDRGKILGGLLKKFRDVEFRDVSAYIGLMKRRGVSPDQAEEEALGDFQVIYARIYAQYEKACREHGQLDFDSMVIEAVALLEDNAEVRARWQFKYILVDEAQDTDLVQLRLVQLMSEKHGNVRFYGDGNQSMYAFRGADPEMLTKHVFDAFPKLEELPLSVNYRSTQAIVAYLKEIAPVQNEAVRKMNSVGVTGEPIEFKYFYGDDREAEVIVSTVTDPDSTAVLTRTNRQLRAFERACMNKCIRYRLLGDSGFWKQDEIRKVMAVVQTVVAPSDNSVKQVIRSPYDFTRFLKKTEAIERLEDIQAQRPEGLKLHHVWKDAIVGDTRQNEILHGIVALFERLRGQVFSLSGEQALKRILDEANILNYYRDNEHAKEIDNDPVENIQDLLKDAKKFPSLYEFYLYARKAAHAPERETGLTLSTVHSAKGKQWNTVFVAGVNDGVLPHKNGEPEEEKCIYYVACSRAALKLTVSCNDIPSPYIRHKLPKQLDQTSFAVAKDAKQFQSLLELV